MEPKKWNLLYATGFGALFGVGFSLYGVFNDTTPLDPVYIAGAVIGGALGGAILFALLAGARNLIFRAK